MDEIVAGRTLASEKVTDGSRIAKSKATKRNKKQSKKEKAREKKSKKKRKRRHSSSSSSDTSDSSSDSSSSSSSSSEDEKAKKRRRKMKKEKAKMKKKAKSIAKKKKKLAAEALLAVPTPVVPVVIPEADVGPNISLSSSKIRAPMTKEEYEKQQSTLKWIVDPETGRRRYMLSFLTFLACNQFNILLFSFFLD